MPLPPLSILELAATEQGRSAREALAASAAMVRRAEELGVHRVWFAEHHGAPVVVSVSPPVLIAHTAATTTRIRVGSGGVLLPNHSPRVVAEQFATLDALHPERIDLGIGRGPGTFDPAVVAALRRGAPPSTDDSYRAEVRDLLAHLSPTHTPPVLPGSIPAVQPWMLSSSTAGSALAAELGLPLAFAHHMHPDKTIEALSHYRDTFRPSPWGERPHVMISVETVCAETDADVTTLARPIGILRATVLTGGTELRGLSPAAAAEVPLSPEVEDQIAQYRAQQAYGTPTAVAARLAAIAKETDADEIMLATVVYDPAARQRSLALTIEAAR